MKNANGGTTHRLLVGLGVAASVIVLAACNSETAIERAEREVRRSQALMELTAQARYEYVDSILDNRPLSTPCDQWESTPTESRTARPPIACANWRVRDEAARDAGLIPECDPREVPPVEFEAICERFVSLHERARNAALRFLDADRELRDLRIEALSDGK